jgi:hypothetical protein
MNAKPTNQACKLGHQETISSHASFRGGQIGGGCLQLDLCSVSQDGKLFIDHEVLVHS